MKASGVVILVGILALAGVFAILVDAGGPKPTTTNTTTALGTLSDCGFGTTCAAQDSVGLVLSLSVNSTTVRSNGSLTYSTTLRNLASHSINVSRSVSWYMLGLPGTWPCYNGAVPFGIGVFRGYYDLANVTEAQNILHPDVYPSCLYMPSPSSFSFPAGSAFSPPYTFQSSEIYAIDGGSVRSGGVSVGVNSLRSSQPVVYTMIAEDQWGGFVLLHFSVVS